MTIHNGFLRVSFGVALLGAVLSSTAVGAQTSAVAASPPAAAVNPPQTPSGPATIPHLDPVGTPAAVAPLRVPAPAPQTTLQEPLPGQLAAKDFIQDLGDKALVIVLDKGLTEARKKEAYRQLLRNAFDLPAIGQFVLGRAWNEATPSQREEYLRLFEAMVLDIYGDRLSFYNGERFRVKGERSETGRDSVVSSEILHPGGMQPTSVEWRVHRKDGRYVVTDVIIEGISQSVTQRQEYAAILQRSGGDMDALLQRMREKVKGSDALATPKR